MSRHTPRSPCFFCGSPTYVRAQVHAGRWFFVECTECGARGPRVEDSRMASLIWNGGEPRPYPPSRVRAAIKHGVAPGLREPTTDAWRILQELVELKRLKDFAESTGHPWLGPEQFEGEKKAAQAEYARRKPIAWDNARAALSASQGSDKP